MSDLTDIRSQIDHLDEEILAALAARRKLTQEVIRTKDDDGLDLRDSNRETEVLTEVITKGRQLGLDAHFITRIFHEVIDDSLRAQQLFLLEANPEKTEDLGQKRIAFQGIEGAYTKQAAERFFSPKIDRCTLTGYSTFEKVAKAVEDGEVDYGVLPVENSTAGSVNETYDMLSRHHLYIVGEEVFRVEHCLLGVEEIPLSELRRICSHPLGISQCTKFVNSLPQCETEYLTNTAVAAAAVAKRGDRTHAAIASEDAGRAAGLVVLKRNIADRSENFTRFIVIAPEPVEVDQRIACKTSLVIATANERGALLRTLEALDRQEINLTKLESRPRPDTPFQYLFYLDFEGNLADSPVQHALNDIRNLTTYMKVLGSYPSDARAKTAPAIETLVNAPSKVEANPDATIDEAPKKKVSYQLASRQTKSENTIISLKGVEIGGPEMVMIAGPCSVESREQIMTCARHVKEAGGRILRGGCFKPRTSPYSFQGLGYEGLELLAEAGRAYDLPIITEVLSPGDVQRVAETADILQIGARNMQNFTLLNEAGKVNRPVLLKRGMMSTIDEFLNAAEYILDKGNHQVILCERGIRTFETTTRNTLDLGAIPIIRRLTHLPIIVDPSHAAGERDLVIPLALAACGVAPSGLMVEIHPEPEKALSDGPQALRFPAFTELMRTIYSKNSVPEMRAV